MVIVDLIIAGIILAAAVWGYREGLSTTAFALAGFAVGAMIGSQVAPLILDDGLSDRDAPAVALPAALLLGGLGAAAFERLGLRQQHRIPHRGALDVAGGALVAACVAVVAVWVVGTAAAQVDDLKDTVRDSAVIEELNAAVPPPGPPLDGDEPRDERLPAALPANPADIKTDPQILAAAPSVVRIRNNSPDCRGRGSASGWVARPGVVVTNAHVVGATARRNLGVQIRGRGRFRPGRVTWFDKANDVAIMRVPGLRAPALRLGRELRGGTRVAALGFPSGGPYTVLRGKGKKDPSSRLLDRVKGEDPVTVRTSEYRIRGVTHGNSGGPVLDRRGHVRTMISGPEFGVTMEAIRRALGGPNRSVPHKTCLFRGE